ncbi:hypothetical protein [Spiroplasma endosymbiont of Dasysyrphus albostriatus]|uniref:hypothetical protein n=1 Tax=Spiroplasma endosymbiont of Dasysyrphus albostriatus TaxID=3066299 RepID=UPI0030CE8D78
MSELDFLFNEEKVEQFIKEAKKDEQMKKYNKSFNDLNEILKQYYNCLDRYNAFINSNNNRQLNLKNKIKKWFLSKNIQFLKTKRSLAEKKLRLAEHNIYWKILSLYFDDNSLNGKRLYFYEYEQWKKIFIEFANIKMNELQGFDLENIKIITNTVQTLFLDVFRDETFQNKHELEVIKVKNLMEKFIYETINSKEILSFQVAFANHKLVNEQYNNLKDNQESVLKEINLKIKVITDKIEKNNMKLQKIKNIWFYKIWKCRQLKKSNKNWEIKLGEKIAEKEFFLKKFKNLYTKSLDQSTLKKAELDLSAKLLAFYLEQNKSKNLKFSEYEVWKVEFIATCEKVIKNLEFNSLKIELITNFAVTLFKDVLKNIELQKKYEIKVINDDNDLSSQLDSDTCLVSESGISEWSDSFGESINIDMNINFHSPKQTVVA